MPIQYASLRDLIGDLNHLSGAQLKLILTGTSIYPFNLDGERATKDGDVTERGSIVNETRLRKILLDIFEKKRNEGSLGNVSEEQINAVVSNNRTLVELPETLASAYPAPPVASSSSAPNAALAQARTTATEEINTNAGSHLKLAEAAVLTANATWEEAKALAKAWGVTDEDLDADTEVSAAKRELDAATAARDQINTIVGEIAASNDPASLITRAGYLKTATEEAAGRAVDQRNLALQKGIDEVTRQLAALGNPTDDIDLSNASAANTAANDANRNGLAGQMQTDNEAVKTNYQEADTAKTQAIAAKVRATNAQGEIAGAANGLGADDKAGKITAALREAAIAMAKITEAGQKAGEAARLNQKVINDLAQARTTATEEINTNAGSHLKLAEAAVVTATAAWNEAKALATARGVGVDVLDADDEVSEAKRELDAATAARDQINTIVGEIAASNDPASLITRAGYLKTATEEAAGRAVDQKENALRALITHIGIAEDDIHAEIPQNAQALAASNLVAGGDRVTALALSTGTEVTARKINAKIATLFTNAEAQRERANTANRTARTKLQEARGLQVGTYDSPEAYGTAIQDKIREAKTALDHDDPTTIPEAEREAVEKAELAKALNDVVVRYQEIHQELATAKKRVELARSQFNELEKFVKNPQNRIGSTNIENERRAVEQAEQKLREITEGLETKLTEANEAEDAATVGGILATPEIAEITDAANLGHNLFKDNNTNDSALNKLKTKGTTVLAAHITATEDLAKTPEEKTRLQKVGAWFSRTFGSGGVPEPEPEYDYSSLFEKIDQENSMTELLDLRELMLGSVSESGEQKEGVRRESAFPGEQQVTTSLRDRLDKKMANTAINYESGRSHQQHNSQLIKWYESISKKENSSEAEQKEKEAMQLQILENFLAKGDQDLRTYARSAYIDMQQKHQKNPNAQLLSFPDLIPPNLLLDRAITSDKIKAATAAYARTKTRDVDAVLTQKKENANIGQTADEWNQAKEAVEQTKNRIKAIKEALTVKRDDAKGDCDALTILSTATKKQEAEEKLRKLEQHVKILEGAEKKAESALAQINDQRIDNRADVATLSRKKLDALIRAVDDASGALNEAYILSDGFDISDVEATPLAPKGARNIDDERNVLIAASRLALVTDYKEQREAERSVTSAQNIVNPGMGKGSFSAEDLAKLNEVRAKGYETGQVAAHFLGKIDEKYLRDLSDPVTINNIVGVLYGDKPIKDLPIEMFGNDQGIYMYLNDARNAGVAFMNLEPQDKAEQLRDRVTTQVLEKALSLQIPSLDEEALRELVTKDSLSEVKQHVSDSVDRTPLGGGAAVAVSYQEMKGYRGNYKISAELKNQAAVKLLDLKVRAPDKDLKGETDDKLKKLTDYRDGLLNLLRGTDLTQDQLNQLNITAEECKAFNNIPPAEKLEQRKVIAEKLLKVQARLGDKNLCEKVPLDKHFEATRLTGALGVGEDDARTLVDHLLRDKDQRETLNRELVKNMLIRAMQADFPLPEDEPGVALAASKRGHLQSSLGKLGANAKFEDLGQGANLLSLEELSTLGFSCSSSQEATNIKSVLVGLGSSPHDLGTDAGVKATRLKALIDRDERLKRTNEKAKEFTGSSTPGDKIIGAAKKNEAEDILKKAINAENGNPPDDYIVTEELHSEAALFLAKNDLTTAMSNARDAARTIAGDIPKSPSMTQLLALGSIASSTDATNTALRSHLNKSMAPLSQVAGGEVNQLEALSREPTARELSRWAANNAVLLAISERGQHEVVSNLLTHLNAGDFENAKEEIRKLTAVSELDETSRTTLLANLDLKEDSDFKQLLIAEAAKGQFFAKVSGVELTGENKLKITDQAGLVALVKMGPVNDPDTVVTWPTSDDKTALEAFFGVTPLQSLSKEEFNAMQKKAAHTLVDALTQANVDPNKKKEIALQATGDLALLGIADCPVTAAQVQAVLGDSWQERIAERYAAEYIDHSIRELYISSTDGKLNWEQLAKLANCDDFNTADTGFKAKIKGVDGTLTDTLLTRAEAYWVANPPEADDRVKAYRDAINDKALAACLEKINANTGITKEQVNEFCEKYSGGAGDAEFNQKAAALGIEPEYLVSCLGEANNDAHQALRNRIVERGLELTAEKALADIYTLAAENAPQTEKTEKVHKQALIDKLVVKLSETPSPTLQDALAVKHNFGTVEASKERSAQQILELGGATEFIAEIQKNEEVKNKLIADAFKQVLTHRIKNELSIVNGAGDNPDKVNDAKLNELIALPMEIDKVKDYLKIQFPNVATLIESQFTQKDFDAHYQQILTERRELLVREQNDKIFKQLVSLIDGVELENSVKTPNETNINQIERYVFNSANTSDDYTQIQNYLNERSTGQGDLFAFLDPNSKQRIQKKLLEKQQEARSLNPVGSTIADPKLKQAINEVGASSPYRVQRAEQLIRSQYRLSYEELKNNCEIIFKNKLVLDKVQEPSQQELSKIEEAAEEAAIAQLAHNYARMQSATGTPSLADYNTALGLAKTKAGRVTIERKLRLATESNNSFIEANKLSLVLFGNLDKAADLHKKIGDYSASHYAQTKGELDTLLTAIGIQDEPERLKLKKYLALANAREQIKFSNSGDAVGAYKTTLLDQLGDDFKEDLTIPQSFKEHFKDFAVIFDPDSLHANRKRWCSEQGDKDLDAANGLLTTLESQLQHYGKMEERLQQDLDLIGELSSPKENEKLVALKEKLAAAKEVHGELQKMKDLVSRGIDGVHLVRRTDKYTVFNRVVSPLFTEQEMTEGGLQKHCKTNLTGRTGGGISRAQEKELRELKSETDTHGKAQVKHRTLTFHDTVKQKSKSASGAEIPAGSSINVGIQNTGKGRTVLEIGVSTQGTQDSNGNPTAKSLGLSREEAYKLLSREQQKALVMQEVTENLASGGSRTPIVVNENPTSQLYWDTYDALQALAPTMGFSAKDIKSPPISRPRFGKFGLNSWYIPVFRGSDVSAVGVMSWGDKKKEAKADLSINGEKTTYEQRRDRQAELSDKLRALKGEAATNKQHASKIDSEPELPVVGPRRQ